MRLWFGILLFIFAQLPALAAELDAVPEVAVPPGSQSYCVIRSEVRGDSQSKRNSVVSFIRAAYEQTEHWRRDYIVAAVDYVQFSQFYVVLYVGCPDIADSASKVQALFANGSDTDRVTIKFSRADETGIIARYSEPELPIFLSDKFRGRSTLRDCTVRVPLRITKGGSLRLEEVVPIQNALLQLQLKYRMPIIDVYLVDNSFYLLLSRDCQHRETLLARAKNLLRDDGLEWEEHFEDPEFGPDVATYRYKETAGNKPAAE